MVEKLENIMFSENVFLFAIGTSILFAAYGLLARIFVKKSDNPLAFSVWINIFASLIALPLLVLEGGSFTQITMVIVLITFLSTVLSGVFESIQFFVRKHLEASRSTVLSQVTPLVTFIGAVIFLGESITLTKFSGAILVILGNVIAAYKHGGALNKKWVLLSVIGTTALGGVYIADKFASPHYPIGFYIILSYLLPALYVFLLIRKDRLSVLRYEYKQYTWRLPLLALTSVLGYYLILKTFRFAEASTVLPIVYTSSILVALGGIILLKERNNIVQKLAGAAVVFIGVLVLTY